MPRRHAAQQSIPGNAKVVVCAIPVTIDYLRIGALYAPHSMPVWISWPLLTLASWGIWAVLSKMIGGAITEAQLQAISTLGVLPILAALLATKDSTTANDRRLGILLALSSGIISCAGNIAYYAALSHAKA